MNVNTENRNENMYAGAAQSAGAYVGMNDGKGSAIYGSPYAGMDTMNAQGAAANRIGVRTGMLSQENDDEITIDLGEVFGVIVHWLWLILVVAIAFGAAAYSFSKFVLPEEFQSTTKIYVLDKKSSTSSGQSTYTDLQVGSQLTKDYAELITSRTVIEKVISDNGLNELYDYKTFLDKVSVDTPTDTRIVSITVTDHDPALAQTLANSIRTEAAELIISTMQIDAVNTYEEANLPTVKSAPSCGKWAIIAAFLGALLVSVLVVVRYILDDTVKTSEDVERYLGLSVLAMIPLDENIGAAAAEDKKARKKNKKNKKSEPVHHRQTKEPPTRQRVVQEIKASEADKRRNGSRNAGSAEHPERSDYPEHRNAAAPGNEHQGPNNMNNTTRRPVRNEGPAREAGRPERRNSEKRAAENGSAAAVAGKAPQQSPVRPQPTQKNSAPQPADEDELSMTQELGDILSMEDFLSDDEMI